MRNRRFDGLLIDFYGTISAGDRLAVETACRHIVDTLRLPMSAEEFTVRWGECFFQVVENSNYEAFRTLYECELTSLRQTLAPMVGHVEPEPFVSSLEAYWRDPPVHGDALEFLANVDIPVCCVSNADTEPLLAAIEKHGLKFDAIVTSEQARCYKPETGIFRMAIDALDVEPERTVHVGDSLHSDVSGASKTGIATAWVCRGDRIHDIGMCRPMYTLSNLSELGRLLS